MKGGEADRRRLLCLRDGSRPCCYSRLLQQGDGQEPNPRHDLQLPVRIIPPSLFPSFVVSLLRLQHGSCVYRGAASGIDLNSDELIQLAEHKNCFGVKLTCAMIGKGHRLAAHVQSNAWTAQHGDRLKSMTNTGGFAILPGFSESLLPALVSRHTGCITGTGNVFPKTIRRLYDLSIKGLKGDAAALAEALGLQDRSEDTRNEHDKGPV